MVREIIRDTAFLSQVSEPATAADLPVADDLLETLIAHRDGCVGMAANMIGVSRRIIAIEHKGGYLVLLNPVILKKSGPYETQEGCLSLEGTRPARRWRSVKVRYQNRALEERFLTFTDFSAQILQHELDHCDGILI